MQLLNQMSSVVLLQSILIFCTIFVLNEWYLQQYYYICIFLFDKTSFCSVVVEDGWLPLAASAYLFFSFLFLPNSLLACHNFPVGWWSDTGNAQKSRRKRDGRSEAEQKDKRGKTLKEFDMLVFKNTFLMYKCGLIRYFVD